MLFSPAGMVWLAAQEPLSVFTTTITQAEVLLRNRGVTCWDTPGTVIPGRWRTNGPIAGSASGASFSTSQ